MQIHPTAIIDSNAILGANVKIGPYCIVGPKVNLHDNVELKSHVVVEGRTTVGEGTIIHQFASIGNVPQDLKYTGEDSELVIGKNNVIREYANLNIGTAGGGSKTAVGDNCLIMVGVHVAHDCVIGNNVILANHVTFGGHVVVEDHVVIGGLTAVHQFVRIGVHAMIGGASGVRQDVCPYTLALGNPAKVEGLNVIGLRRRGFTKEDISTIERVFTILFDGSMPIEQLISKINAQYASHKAIEVLLHFLRIPSSRGLCKPEKTHA